MKSLYGIHSSILNTIDIVEVPLNAENKWIVEKYSLLHTYGVQVITRSLFVQGSILNGQKNKHDIIKDKVASAIKLSDYVAIGMSTKEQITKNISLFKQL